MDRYKIFFQQLLDVHFSIQKLYGGFNVQIFKKIVGVIYASKF